MLVLVLVTTKIVMIMKMMALVMMTLKIMMYHQYTGDDYIFAVPALSVRLVVPPAPIVAGRLYTVDCQVDCIF